MSAAATTSAAAAAQPLCTWLGHCLGDNCGNDNDCDNDWICVASKCAVAPPSHALSKATVAAISAGVPLFIALVVGLGIFWLWKRRSRRKRIASLESDASTRGQWTAYDRSIPHDRKSAQEMRTLQSPVELEDMAWQAAELSADEPNKTAGAKAMAANPPDRGVQWQEVDLGLHGWHECPPHQEDTMAGFVSINFSRPRSASSRTNTSPPLRRSPDSTRERTMDRTMMTNEMRVDDAGDDGEDEDDLSFREDDPYAFFSWPRPPTQGVVQPSAYG